MLKNSLNLLNVVFADRPVPSCVRPGLAAYLGAEDGEVVVGAGTEAVGGKDADWAPVSASIVKDCGDCVLCSLSTQLSVEERAGCLSCNRFLTS